MSSLRGAEKSGIEAQIHVARDGEQTIRFLDEADANPRSAVSESYSSRHQHAAVQNPAIVSATCERGRCANALVLIVTSSDSVEDREEMERLGANGYFRKPSEVSEMMKLGQRVRELLALSDAAGSA